MNMATYFQSKIPADFGVVGLTEESKSMLLDMDERGYIGCVYDSNEENMKAFFENEAKDTDIFAAKDFRKLVRKLKRYTSTKNRFIVIADPGASSIDTLIEKKLLPHMRYNDYIIDISISGREVSTKRVNDLSCRGIRYISSIYGASASLLQGIIIGGSHLSNKFEDLDDYDSEQSTSESEDESEVETPRFCCRWGGRHSKEKCFYDTLRDIARHNGNFLHEVQKFLRNILSLDYRQLKFVCDEWIDDGLNFMSTVIFIGKKTSDPTLGDSDTRKWIDHLKNTVYACKMIIYAQYVAKIIEIDNIHQWNINYAKYHFCSAKDYLNERVILCKIKAAFTKNPQLSNLLLDEDIAKIVHDNLPSIKEIVEKIASSSTKLDTFSECLEYYEDFTANRLVCAKFLKTPSSDEKYKLLAKLDLSPLAKYQYQLKFVHWQLEKVDNFLMESNKHNPQPGESHMKEQTRLQRLRLTTYKFLHMEIGRDFKSCMKHLEKDEEVAPLLVEILDKRYKKTIKLLSKCRWRAIKSDFKLIFKI